MNPMSVNELEQRMRGFFNDSFEGALIEHASDVVGYALWKQKPDPCNPSQSAIYVRQFFIERTHRRRGIGRTAFNQIVTAFFPSNMRITLEVLETNPAGHAFWRDLGFTPHVTSYVRDG